MYESDKGKESQQVAKDLCFLGLLYSVEGKEGEMNECYKRALPIYSKLPKPYSPEIASYVFDIASRLYEHKRYLEAQPLFIDVLTSYENSFGPDGTRTALVLNALASCYQEQGKYNEAEPLFRRALAISRNKTSTHEIIRAKD